MLARPLPALAATNDGQPWVDYSIQDNVKDAAAGAITDDFYWAVNREWLNHATIKPGDSSTNEFSAVSEAVDGSVQKLWTDASLTGHEAALSQTLSQDFMDWDTRNKAGMKPLRATV